MSFRNILKKNEVLVIVYDKFKEIYYKSLSDEKFLEKQFEDKVGRKLDLDNPKYFNDKLQWLKLNWENSLATQCADKFEVRKFIKERIGEKYLNELYGVYNSVDEINIHKLPQSFVLKGTHGSGFNLICKNKDEIDWDVAFKSMRRWLRKKYYLQNREWVYKGIKPRIICERFLEQDGDDELRDYRFFCFNGEPKIISVDLSITNKENTRRNLYDLEWNLLDGEISYPKELSKKIEKPQSLDLMIELSKKVSAGFPHARVDFYNIGELVIFGEITFFHQSGMGKFNTLEFEMQLGENLKLPL
ncbi:hypothetical protein JYK21_04760 [Ralstonia pickettii]|nr:hypothetical protein [Ralstonia pickettii]